MATATIEKALVIQVPPEILGPASEYEKRRLALKGDAQKLLAEARKVTAVTDPETLENANNFGRLLQAQALEVGMFFKPIKQQIDALKKPVLAAENELSDSLDVEKRRLGGLITEYNIEQERKRQEEERIRREEAEKAAREEMLARAVELDLSGDHEAAEAVLEEPVFAPVIAPQEAPARMAGQVGKLTYSCRVKDVKSLLKAVAEGKAPLQCFVIDQSWLNKKAALDRDGFNLPGCELVKTSSTHFRS